MREQGRRGGVIRSLLGVARLAEDDGAGAEEGGSKKEDGGGAERKAVVRVVAADMPPALQRRAFRCARDELAGMPHFPRRLEPKRLALALKKVTNHDWNSIAVSQIASAQLGREPAALSSAPKKMHRQTRRIGSTYVLT